MEFKQIEAFVNVVKYGSFSKAADATFFTQPTISSHVSNLEAELGVKLLERKARNVKLTPSGVRFYKHAIEMINTRAQAMEDIGKVNDRISGVLEIQTSSIPGVTFLPEFLAGFRKIHGEVQYYVSLSDTSAVIAELMERRGDIGFVGDEISNRNIESVKIATDRAVMIAPKSMDIPSVITMAQAVTYPFIWRESGSATRKLFENEATALGFDKQTFNNTALFNDLDASIRAVEAGLGVAIVSEKIAVSLSDKVRMVKISDFSLERSFYIIRLKNTALSPVAEAFFNYVVTESKKEEVK